MLLLFGMMLFSQTLSNIFNEITDKDGLKSIQDIEAILQDSKGFIWIGSAGTLRKYDGYESIDYDHKINYVYMNHFTEDSKGILWISINFPGGIYLMDLETEQVIYYLPDIISPPKNDLYAYNINKVIEDKNGTIWSATQNGLLKMEPKVQESDRLKEMIFKKGIEDAYTISVFYYDTTLSVNNMLDVFEDSRKRLWIGSPNGLYLFNRENNEFVRADADKDGKTKLTDQQINEITEENPDVLWVRTLNGFSRISNADRAFSDTFIKDLNFSNYLNAFGGTSTFIDSRNNYWIGTRNDGLIHLSFDKNQNAIFEGLYNDVHQPDYNFGAVLSIMEDRTDLLWIGHDCKGMKTLRYNKNPFTRLEGMLGDLPGIRYDFNRIYKDDDGNLWICSFGNGIFRIDRHGKVVNYNITDPAYPGLNGNNVWNLLEIDNGIFWIASSTGIYQLDTRTGNTRKITNIPYTQRMIKIDDYVLCAGNRLSVYDLNSNNINVYAMNQDNTLGLASNFIIEMCLMKNGEILVSTLFPSELYRLSLDKTTGVVNFLPLPEYVVNNRQAILETGKGIFDIYEDKNNVIWFATYHNGLIKLNKETGELLNFTVKDGLNDNWVTFITEDNRGYIWIATHTGLSMLDQRTGNIKTFNEHDGLPDVTHSYYLSPVENAEGKIYLGGIGGFYSFHPDSIQKNDIIPPVVITDFRLSNQSVEVDTAKNAILTKNISYTHEIRLKYNQNDLSFTFAALDYNDPSRNRYTYIMEGYQDEWIETDANNRIATYTNLSPGEYTFRVKGSNNDGIWNEEGTFIHIIIHPPIWRTIFAYIAYGIIILLLIRGYIFWRTKRIMKEKMVLEKQVSERTADLQHANTRLQEHEQELQEINTLLEEQKEELMQQKEELQSTLENLQKTQEHLIESEKMAALGGLVAGVAHEINTPVGIGVTAISNLMDEVKRMASLYKKDEISRKVFREFLESTQDTSSLIMKNLERTASLIQSFKQVSIDQVSEQKRVFKLKDYLNDIILSLIPKYKHKNITFKVACDPDLELNSYPGAYAQIFTNLLLNSFKHGFAEQEKGTVNIMASQKNNTLNIEYRDDGTGIDPKDLLHVFEPFYTSDKRKGTGLGLNIVYNIIRQKLHGTITCESEKGSGVIFKMDIPVYASAIKAKQ